MWDDDPDFLAFGQRRAVSPAMTSRRRLLCGAVGLLDIGQQELGDGGFFSAGNTQVGARNHGIHGFRDVSLGFSKARLRFLLPNSSQLHGLVPAPASDITSGTLATCLAVASSGWNPVKFRTFSSEIPSGYVNIAIKNGHRNSGFSHETWWFSIVMGQFTRGYQESSGDHDVSQRIFDHLEVQRCLNHGSCTGKQHSLYIWFIWWLNSDAVRLPSADISMYLFSSSI